MRALTLLPAGACVGLGALWGEAWLAAEGMFDLLRHDPWLLVDGDGRDAYWSTFEVNAGAPAFGTVTAVGTAFAVLGGLAIVAMAARSPRLTLVAAGGLLGLAAVLALAAMSFDEPFALAAAALVAVSVAVTRRVAQAAVEGSRG